MKKLLFFLLILLLVTISVHSQQPPPPPILKFVLQWPPTFCPTLNSDKQKWGRCQEPIRQREFTLHGLWPADADGYSIKCAGQPDPNWDKLLLRIEKTLETFWPPLRENSNKRDIWKHEWRAHGACGGTTPQEYFERAIKINDMLEKGNLFNYLATSGIIACDSLAFSKKDIVEAVRKVFIPSSPPPPPRSPPPPPRSPPPPIRSPPPPPPPPPALDVYLTCIPIDKNKTHVYLSEVTLCTNPDGTKFISCPSGAAPTSCSSGAKIMLPHSKAQPPAPSPPRLFQEERDGTYPTFEQSWAKYIFNH
ncbi:hypothetical protein K7X08_011399 [Anisodus acutangulus]|uniref:Uncharacterized protein n=1 Tax=Anisodus acutangulus TaxID=402998 RepID=A0A9Q1MJQ7_9SOLA|nr:hypothetical protein K7X08_011399 [Anisodus acutangulus]